MHRQTGTDGHTGQTRTQRAASRELQPGVATAVWPKTFWRHCTAVSSSVRLLRMSVHPAVPLAYENVDTSSCGPKALLVRFLSRRVVSLFFLRFLFLLIPCQCAHIEFVRHNVTKTFCKNRVERVQFRFVLPDYLLCSLSTFQLLFCLLQNLRTVS